MIQYRVITSWQIDGNNGLETLVNQAIADGWKPIGGVAISHYLMRSEYSDVPNNNYEEYCQAMEAEQ